MTSTIARSDDDLCMSHFSSVGLNQVGGLARLVCASVPTAQEGE